MEHEVRERIDSKFKSNTTLKDIVESTIFFVPEELYDVRMLELLQDIKLVVEDLIMVREACRSLQTKLLNNTIPCFSETARNECLPETGLRLRSSSKFNSPVSLFSLAGTMISPKSPCAVQLLEIAWPLEDVCKIGNSSESISSLRLSDSLDGLASFCVPRLSRDDIFTSLDVACDI
eukprot:CAMPEP_0171558902 /NCGR_PEP_ID=MMETSP0960-20121227/12390_1 /TAXON_ID=87120 /ORGANISM="Aurantiochytrium limacinum, Strain ATCCMYA-1381" /LENGTH=176 /DNA_ID=CAMNT_0012110025 /DNA_START=684 /DNA_END=1215 /DNA_ORIENTATION=+